LTQKSTILVVGIFPNGHSLSLLAGIRQLPPSPPNRKGLKKKKNEVRYQNVLS